MNGVDKEQNIPESQRLDVALEQNDLSEFLDIIYFSKNIGDHFDRCIAAARVSDDIVWLKRMLFLLKDFLPDHQNEHSEVLERMVDLMHEDTDCEVLFWTMVETLKPFPNIQKRAYEKQAAWERIQREREVTFSKLSHYMFVNDMPYTTVTELRRHLVQNGARVRFISPPDAIIDEIKKFCDVIGACCQTRKTEYIEDYKPVVGYKPVVLNVWMPGLEPRKDETECDEEDHDDPPWRLG